MHAKLKDDQERRYDGADNEDHEHRRPIASVSRFEVRATNRARITEA
jgi:hypothetical protein